MKKLSPSVKLRKEVCLDRSPPAGPWASTGMNGVRGRRGYRSGYEPGYLDTAEGQGYLLNDAV